MRPVEMTDEEASLVLSEYMLTRREGGPMVCWSHIVGVSRDQSLWTLHREAWLARHSHDPDHLASCIRVVPRRSARRR